MQLTADRTAGVATRTIVRASIAVGTVASRTFVQAFAPSTAEPMSARAARESDVVLITGLR